MRFIHIADIHASRERLPQTLHILETLTERCKKGDIDFILFAGDFWDSTITATKGSGFSDIVHAIRKLETTVPRIFFIYGTPTHEPLGSLDAFKSDVVQITSTMNYCGCDEYGIIAIPEPRRSNYIGQSIKETDEAINKDISHFIFNQKDRKQTTCKDKPLIVMYHGEVSGAMYQNGTMASSPTAISKEQLQSLKADYYALGHIHMPQEIFPNAWYSGSACPKNFGETHDGHYNLVTINEEGTKVEEVSFGLPTYVTFYERPDNFIEGKPHQNEKTNIRFVFDCTKEERKQMNVRAYAEETKNRLRAMSVKIEPNVIDSEKPAVSEVVKHKSIVEKMEEYAKEKKLKLPKYSKELLQDIQDNTLIKLAYPQHSFELLHLSLRGAIGIRNGQHKDDFELDFEKMEDGVVCLCADNGRGKTTTLENCHPYPCMLSRKGTLKDHFCLKDSHRILIYRDENDLYYKISMLIDGKTTNGKVVYLVETSKDREVWHSLPEVDGSLDSYKEWVNDTFGSIDVFLRTAFFAKEQTKDAVDISDTSKGERMELLSKLAGTEHLKEVSVIARELRKEITKEAEKIATEINAVSDVEGIIEQNKLDITKWKNQLKGQKQFIDTLEKEISELKVKDAEYQKVKATSEANKALYVQYEKELNEKRNALIEFSYLDDDDAEETFDDVKKANEVIAKNTELIEAKEKELKVKKSRNDELTNTVIELGKELTDLQSDSTKLASKMDMCQSQMCEVDGLCPTCGSPLNEHKKEELKEHNNFLQIQYDDYGKSKKEIDSLIAEIKEKTKAAERERDKRYDEMEALDSELTTLADEKVSKQRFLEELSEIFVKYSYNEALKVASDLKADCIELEEKMDDIIYDDNAVDVSEELKEKEAKLKRETNTLNELTSNITVAEKENARYQKNLDEISDKKAELEVLTDKTKAYDFIEDAFSNNGIPAIELKESAPEIADITNKILKESYGNKFEIRFGSTSELKANRKANEDFNIIVLDTENGDEKTIDLVSSGERIWIKQALFYAFSIVQMNRTGFNFRTRLIDESDGSLDGGLRPKYLQMVESAHKYSNSRVTLLITHSQEIKDIAQQIIEI